MLFIGAFVIILACFIVSIAKTNAYNSVRYTKTQSGTELFTSSDTHEGENGVFVTSQARGSTWSKVFDFNNEGLTEHNYQAYTYDFTISDNTGDEVSDFVFKLVFSREVFLSSAWNGSLEIHQNVGDGEIVDTVPDLREFVAEDFAFKTVTFDGETLIPMKPGDYLIYYPSSAENAKEIPIEPNEGTTPGFILYTAIGETIEDSSVELNYQFHRLLTNEPLLWVSAAGMALWLMAVVNYTISAAQIKKYRERHERDNEIISESIETFTGFIDAKDPYTNGHSKRVAEYTKMIAREMGYEGEELDRIYYIALLHDCGKIGVPDNILKKPGKLTDEEFEIIKSHTVRGGEILSNFKSLKDVGEGARYHHERYDGRGYPEGRSGEDIPLIARIIGVADSFDAMNTNRVYRNKLTKETIISEIENNKGKQFDPQIADVMLRLIKEGKIKVANK
jgi:putative nucleotidyltransferase with HDIG domain